jgi:hypothetical protein
MVYIKKAQAQKKVMAARVSNKDQKEILRLHNTGGYTDKEIAEEVGHSEGKVGYWIRKLKGTRRMVRVAKNPKGSVAPTVKQKITKVKGDNLTENEKNLHKDVLNLLQNTKSGDEFVQEYYKKYGFKDVFSINVIIDMWSHRSAIFKFVKEKEDENRRKELLRITGAVKKPVIEEPIKEEKRHTFADEGEQLVKINHRLSEMIAITGEILQIQKNTYILFKEKMDSGKKDDGNLGKPTHPQTT